MQTTAKPVMLRKIEPREVHANIQLQSTDEQAAAGHESDFQCSALQVHLPTGKYVMTFPSQQAIPPSPIVHASAQDRRKTRGQAARADTVLAQDCVQMTKNEAPRTHHAHQQKTDAYHFQT